MLINATDNSLDTINTSADTHIFKITCLRCDKRHKHLASPLLISYCIIREDQRSESLVQSNYRDALYRT